MTIFKLVKPGTPLEADGMITIYEISSGQVVAKYEGLEVHEKMVQADVWKKERLSLLEMTMLLDEHPKGYDGPCLCESCCSYD